MIKNIINIMYSVCNELNTILINTLKYSNNVTYEGQELRKYWIIFLERMSDEQIERYLNKCNIYNYSISIDGRKNCESKIIDYNVNNNYQPYYI